MPTSAPSSDLAASYFQSIALPNYREFLAAQTDLRRAWNAAVSISHTIDYMAADAGASDPHRFRKELIMKHPPLEIATSLCNAFKHVTATRGAKDGVPFIAAWDVGVPAPGQILWVDEREDGTRREYRRSDASEFLFTTYTKDGKTRPIWIGVTLYCAIRQLASILKWESPVGSESLPDLFHLNFRDHPPIASE